jgi:DNA protecting protein DprA
MNIVELVRYVFSQSVNLLLPHSRIEDGHNSELGSISKASVREAAQLYFNHYASETEKSVLEQKGLCDFEFLAEACMRHLYKLRDIGGCVLLPSMPWFPDALRHLPDAPIGLNIIGEFSHLSNLPSASIVGSRKACRDSVDSAHRLGKALAEAGYAVVSGGAYGCDISAHLGVLESNSPENTVLVMAGGLDELYPKGNERIFKKLIAKGGCVVSERLCFDKPRPYYFLVRNRLIAGLSQSVFVIQAAGRSGALYTASRALDYGRDVYTSDTFRNFDSRFEGNQTLIRDGAMSLENFWENELST